MNDLGKILKVGDYFQFWGSGSNCYFPARVLGFEYNEVVMRYLTGGRVINRAYLSRGFTAKHNTQLLSDVEALRLRLVYGL